MQNSQELVSVIIPVYNHEIYVEEALSSVYNQTYPCLEVIIIDDGSKDNSVSKIEEWLKKNQEIVQRRKTIFIKQANQGAHVTINSGLHMAKGHYLTILNSDDYFHLKRIETLVNKLENENGRFAFSRIHTVDQHGQAIPRGHWWLNWYEKSLVQTCDPTTGFRFLRHNIAISTGNFFFTKELYLEIGDFRDFKLSHDYDFVMRVMTVSEPLFVDEELYYYRIHSENTTNKVQHLGQVELDEIHRQYLAMTVSPPKNKIAPCHHYWPLTFAYHRRHLGLDRGLTTYLEDIKPEAKNSEPLTAKPLINGKKMTLFSHELSLSGGPKLLSDVALSLAKNGFQPKVLALKDGPLRKVLEAEGISVSVIPSYLRFWENDSSFLRRGFKLFGALLFILLNCRGAFFSNTTSAWPLALTTCFAFPWKSFYWYIHESCGPEALIPGGVGMKLFRKALRENKIQFLFGSKATKELWNECGVKGSTLYWSGINAASSFEKRESIQNLLSVGSGEPRKGFHTIVEAFIKLVNEERIPKSVTLTLVGFSKTLNQMQNFNSDLILKMVEAGVKDRIRLLTQVDREALNNLYAEADLYIQASQMECLPLSLLEAMSRGIPVISSAVDGCIEAVEPHVSGWLFPARNAKLLANAIEEAIKKPQKSYEYAKNAQASFNKKFAIEATEEKLIKSIKEKYAF